MSNKTTVEIAEEVSLLLQLDRTRHQISSKLDLAVLANIPSHIASVFEHANAVGSELTPTQLYGLINKRISEIQAQVYLMRLELENRQPHDPASIYTDPLVISAYGERIDDMQSRPKTFSFGPEILADGWYPIEMNGDIAHRWMRPSEFSIACVPHLGTCAQVLEIEGVVIHQEQLDGFAINAAGRPAEISIKSGEGLSTFSARLTLQKQDVKAANFLPVEFRMESFRTPNEQDSRMLGANINRFSCRPITTGTANS